MIRPEHHLLRGQVIRTDGCPAQIDQEPARIDEGIQALAFHEKTVHHIPGGQVQVNIIALPDHNPGGLVGVLFGLDVKAPDAVTRQVGTGQQAGPGRAGQHHQESGGIACYVAWGWHFGHLSALICFLLTMVCQK